MSARSPAVLVCVWIASCVPARTTVVPVTEMPKPPPGEGWHCFDRVSDTGSTLSTCHRTHDECQSDVVAKRSMGKGTIHSCTPVKAAACTYLWDDEGDSGFQCRSTLAECQRYVALPYSDHNDRQTECVVIP